MTITAIETRYKGYRFRSRLEARWAVFFDALDISWEYEKEGYNLGNGLYYLPDFWLPEFHTWVEIKGCSPTKEELHKAGLLFDNDSWHPVVIFSGPPSVNVEGYGWWANECGPTCDYVCLRVCSQCGQIDWSWNDHKYSVCIEENDTFINIRKCECIKPTDDIERLNEACKAAKSARFEHGECPR